MALVVVPSLTLDQLELDALDWLCVAYACFISSALNYYLYAWANARSSPAFIMAFAPIQNIVTPILAFFVLGRIPQRGSYIGGSIIIAGLFFLIAGRLAERRSTEK